VADFEALLYRFERNISILGRSKSTFENYARHVAAIALHYGQIPTLLDQEQIHEYLYMLQKRSQTPSYRLWTSFFTENGRFALFLLDLHLPEIKKEKKLPVVLSRAEVWAMLKHCLLLKHRILIGLLYGCGLRCLEVRSIRLADLDFDRKNLKVVQGKGKKDRYVPLSDHLIRGLKKYISAEQPTEYLFGGQINGRVGTSVRGGDFDSRYSQKGVQWAVKEAAKRVGVLKDVHVHTLRHSFATHLLEDGLDIITLKDLLGHENIETTMEYLRIAQNGRVKPFSPLDTLFKECSPNTK
jgi:integrase